MKMNKKGFTLIEMLVVIAIIAVLVSIVIPVVGNSTEKAAEAADAANIRSIVAELTIKALADGVAESDTYTMTQKTAGCVSEIDEIGGIDKADVTKIWNTTAGTQITIACSADGKITVTGTSETTPTPTPSE